MIEIMIVVIILGLLMAIAVPYYVQQRGTAQAQICINNMLKIDDAGYQFALERSRKTGDPINFPQDLTPYLRLNQFSQIPPCPAGGSYTLATIGGHATCSLGSSVTPPHVAP